MKKHISISVKFLRKILQIGIICTALVSLVLSANASAVPAVPVSLSHSGEILGGFIVGSGPGGGNGFFPGATFADSTPDGNTIVFTSSSPASSFVPEVNGSGGSLIVSNVFVRNMQTGETRCVSCQPLFGAIRPWGGINPRISANGRYVVFAGPNLASSVNTSTFQIFRADLQTGVVNLVSVGTNGAEGGVDSRRAVISNDGRYVGFTSFAINLVANYSGSGNQLYVRDMDASQTYLASHAFNEPSTAGNAEVEQTQPLSMSGNGRFIVWTSAASNYLFLSNDGNNARDVFFFDVLSSGVNVSTASLDSTGLATGNGASFGGIIAENSGSFPPTVVFASNATNLHSADTNPATDIYCYKGESTARLVSIARDGAAANAPSSNYATVSCNGRFVSFTSKASNLVSGIDEPATTNDVFLRDLQTNSTRYASLNAGNAPSATADGASLPSGINQNNYLGKNISDDGRYIAFITSEPLSVRDGGTTNDIYVRDTAAGVSVLASLNKNGTGGQNGGVDNANDIALIVGGRKVLYTTFATNLFANDSTSTQNSKTAQASVSLLAARPSSDFNGDFLNDYAVFRPSEGNWYSLFDLINYDYDTVLFGENGNRIAPGDYDGDGRTDHAVFIPASGRWDILKSSNGELVTKFFGTANDVITPADFDGDGRTDLAYFRSSTSTWFILQSRNNSLRSVKFGVSGDVPVSGDFDGDNRADIAVFRPSTGDWWILRSADNFFYSFHWGISSDKPVTGDFDGDGKSDAAVFRNGTWYILNSRDNSFQILQWGLSTDRVVVSDYDGDGKSDVAVFRPSDNTWYVLRSSDNSYSAVQWGISGDIPVPSAYIP